MPSYPADNPDPAIYDVPTWEEMDRFDAALYDEDDDCDHDEYDADILTGIASCHRCGHRWMQSFKETEAEHRRIAAYQEYEDRENRLQWWRDRWDRVRSFFSLRRRHQTVSDDDIPF